MLDRGRERAVVVDPWLEEVTARNDAQLGCAVLLGARNLLELQSLVRSHGLGHDAESARGIHEAVVLLVVCLETSDAFSLVLDRHDLREGLGQLLRLRRVRRRGRDGWRLQ